VSTPSFQFYPKQWLGDDKIMLMDWDARGMHFHLLCIAWQQPIACSVPADERIIRRWLGSPKDWPRLKAQIFSAWRLENDRWFQDGLLREFNAQKRRQENGAKGGRPKTKVPDELTPVLPGTENQTETSDLATGSPEVTPEEKPHAIASSSSTSSSSSDSSAANAAVEPAAKGRKVAEPPAWVDPLRREIAAIAERLLRQLTPEQRVLLGRYQAWRFGNYRRSEARNRSRGATIGAAFAKMATSELYGDLTVSEYVEAAAAYDSIRGGSPWTDPFEIRTMIVERAS
jgi:uncharacterized protein YdaU (DUF1376 family)